MSVRQIRNAQRDSVRKDTDFHAQQLLQSRTQFFDNQQLRLTSRYQCNCGIREQILRTFLMSRKINILPPQQLPSLMDRFRIFRILIDKLKSGYTVFNPSTGDQQTGKFILIIDIGRISFQGFFIKSDRLFGHSVTFIQLSQSIDFVNLPIPPKFILLQDFRNYRF